jgi:hypothetical protein
VKGPLERLQDFEAGGAGAAVESEAGYVAGLDGEMGDGGEPRSKSRSATSLMGLGFRATCPEP